jgi:tetratricopeptide (TPR) repeat protein
MIALDNMKRVPLCIFVCCQLVLESAQGQTSIRDREALARKHSTRGELNKVIEVLAPYSNEISDSALLLLAESHRKKSEFDKEVKVLTGYLDRNPKKFRPHYLLGRALWSAQQADLAVEQLRLSVQLAPKHRPSYDLLQDIFTAKKQNYERRILLTDMVKIFGPRKDLLNTLCELYIKDGYLNDARSTCQQAVKKDPRHPANHVHLAQSYLDMENKKSAEKVFMSAARQFPKSEYAQWAAGEFYYREKNYPIAVRYLKQAVAADKSSARSQLGLALSLFEMKSYKEAQEPFLIACQKDASRVAVEALKSAAGQLRQRSDKHALDYEITLAKCGR